MTTRERGYIDGARSRRGEIHAELCASARHGWLRTTPEEEKKTRIVAVAVETKVERGDWRVERAETGVAAEAGRVGVANELGLGLLTLPTTPRLI